MREAQLLASSRTVPRAENPHTGTIIPERSSLGGRPHGDGHHRGGPSDGVRGGDHCTTEMRRASSGQASDTVRATPGVPGGRISPVPKVPIKVVAVVYANGLRYEADVENPYVPNYRIFPPRGPNVPYGLTEDGMLRQWAHRITHQESWTEFSKRMGVEK